VSAAGPQAAFARALLQPDAAIPTNVATWNGSDPAQRFAVYRNNVAVSLIDGLAAKFPVVLQLVGEEFFRAMARVFLGEHPPRSPVMHQFGDALPEFLEGFVPVRELPYLPDVARIEAARVSAYHAADAPAAGPHDFAAIDPERLAETIIKLHPAMRVIPSRHPAYSIWASHYDGEPMETVDLDAAEDTLVTRPAHKPIMSRLPEGVAGLLHDLDAGCALGEAMARAAEATPGFDPAAAFQSLIATGAVAALCSPPQS
jgi:hypothetical protein